ncbi:MAG: hypothetical protein P4N60_20485 [Verrucomicrobiae bacterium]|nr:hypothetical protein [Verrucomicrobiae bacterium]
MKKTLLIAAAALAASVISSQAQVYSQNIVGYVNTPLPGGNHLTMIANPLIGSGGTNGAAQVLTGLTGGENLFIWNGAGYYAYTFNGLGVGTGLGFPSDWTDPNGGAAGSVPGDVYDSGNQVYWTLPPQLNQGQGAFLQNPNTSFTNTFVGTVVLSNTAPIVLSGGNALKLVASTVPLGGSLENTNINLPFIGGENIFIWNGAGYYAYTFNGTGVGTGLGFPSDYTDPNGGAAGSVPGDVYDSVNQVYWTPLPAVNVGGGFFVQNPNSTENWSQNLVIP